MYQKELEVSYNPGIHARPATIISQKASSYNSDIILKKEEAQADLKSLLGVLSLGVRSGEKVIIKAEGNDEKEAVEEIANLINFELEKAINKKFIDKNNSKKEIAQQIDDEMKSEKQYNVESEKLLDLIGKQVKNKIEAIKGLVDIK